MSDSTRKIIDYIDNDNAVNSREEFYSALHDKVSDAIMNRKQEIAQTLIAPEVSTEAQTDNSVTA